MKKLWTLLLAGLVSTTALTAHASQATPATAVSPVALSESDLIINMLLRIKSDQYYKKGEDGEVFYDDLAEYQDWSDLYIKYSNFENLGKDLSREDIKKLLFIGFIAKTNRDAASSQAFSSDLMVVYENNVTTFVEVLAELKFLAPPACHYLNRYFGFEGKNAEKKEGWLKSNKRILADGLGPKEAQACLSHFK